MWTTRYFIRRSPYTYARHTFARRQSTWTTTLPVARPVNVLSYASSADPNSYVESTYERSAPNSQSYAMYQEDVRPEIRVPTSLDQRTHHVHILLSILHVDHPEKARHSVLIHQLEHKRDALPCCRYTPQKSRSQDRTCPTRNHTQPSSLMRPRSRRHIHTAFLHIRPRFDVQSRVH